MMRVISILLLLVVCGTASSQSIVVGGFSPKDGKFPVEGQPTQITLDGATLKRLEVTYRPRSRIEQTVQLEPDLTGVVSWTPKWPGLAAITAYTHERGAEPHAKLTVSVAFASTLTLGVAVMAVAGLVLFGGAFISIRALLRGQKSDE